MMKEKTIPKAPPRRVKGTVLFTVVCVMLVLIVFLMGALALAVTANNRAMKNYSSSQTQQTAKAGVQAIISGMQNNLAVAQEAANVTDTNSVVQVTGMTFLAEDGTEQTALGHITDAKIEYVGKKWVNAVDNMGNATQKQKTILRISVTATQANESSTYSAYVLRDAEPNSTVESENKGFVATGSATSSNHASIYGGAYIGFDKLFATQNTNPAAPFTTYTVTCASDVTFETDMQVNGNLDVTGSLGMNLVFKSPKTGLTVWGDMDLSANLLTPSVNALAADYPATSPMNYTDVPYIYVDGKFIATGSNQKTLSDQTVPLNIYCRTAEIDHYDINADIYAFGDDPADKTTLSAVTNTNLYTWTAGIIEYGETSGKQHNAGGVYANHDVDISVSNGDFRIGGDLVVNGDLTLSNTGSGRAVYVDGDVIVKGTLNTQGTGLYLKKTPTHTSKLKCDNVVGDTSIKYNDQNGGAVTSEKLTVGTRVVKTPQYKTEQKYAYLVQGYNLNNTGNKDYWVKEGYEPYLYTNSMSDYIIKQATVDGQLTNRNTDEDGTVWYGDNNGRRANAEKYDVYIRVADDVVVDESEATMIVDAEGNPATAADVYPKEYTRDVLLGIRDMNGKAKGDEDYTSRAKVITTVSEILNSSQNPYNTSYDVPSGVTVPAFPIVSNAVNVVKNSCTLTGNWGGTTQIVIQAPSSGSSIWVVLEDFSMGNSCALVVDDLSGTGTVNFVIKGTVYLNDGGNATIPMVGTGAPSIYFPTGMCYLVSAKAVQALQDNYVYQMYTDLNLALTETAVVDDPTPEDPNHKKTVTVLKKGTYNGKSFASNVEGKDGKFPQPNINVYAPQSASTATASANLGFGNNQIITANIKAPYLDVKFNNNGNIKVGTNKILYNGIDIGSVVDNPIGLIGCCVCREFSCTNNWEMLFNGTSAGVANDVWDDSLMNSWQILYYENY